MLTLCVFCGILRIYIVAQGVVYEMSDRVLNKKMSLYISKRNMNAYAGLLALNPNDNFSDIIGSAVNEQLIRTLANVQITEGAYCCLADGRFDLVRRVCLDDGTSLILMKDPSEFGDIGVYNHYVAKVLDIKKLIGGASVE